MATHDLEPDDDAFDVESATRQIGIERASIGSRPRATGGSGRPTDPASRVIAGHPEVLRGEEVARARGFAAITVFLTSAGLAFTPLLPLAMGMKVLLAATLLGPFMGTSFWVLARTRDEAGYTPQVFRVFGWAAAAGSIVLVYCLGVFSPTPLVVTLGIYFFGQGIDRRYAVTIPVVAILGYFALAVAIVLGAVADRGVFTAAGVPFVTQTFFVIMAPLVLLVTLWMARLSRRSVDDAVARTTRAMQLAIEREAQLAEAQQELEIALRAGAGQGGRYTGAAAGVYELGAVIGRGAMGEVYAATERLTDGRAAVKVLRADVALPQQSLDRFLREGQIAGSLDVPNVVRVFGADVFADGTPYIVMELLAGEDLAALLRQRRHLKERELHDLVNQVARGLAAAHAAGIVHRDLKPQNLFCHRSGDGDIGTWKILDFGVSKVAGSDGTLTQAHIVGTPGYMAPEQARGRYTDQRADVFSLGAVMYRAATGRPPFSGPDLPQILFNIVYATPPRPSVLVSGLPRDVDLVLALALAKDPEDRLTDAGGFASAWDAAIESRLPSSLRARAEALVSRFPWGAPGQVATGRDPDAE